MKLLKPAWVSHDGHPIFSVDIHPDGSRFATGGQGDDCGRVVVWNMEPVVSDEAEHDDNVPKVLCQMDNHLACVNCVRWSVSGRFLASCGDDKVILVWQHSRSSGSSGFGGSGGGPEPWRCVATLRAHSGDVLDLAWAPHDAWLASCSVDNTVIVWSALNMPEVVAVLKGHSGLVKGVAWDPVGKFLASQSDDKSLRVWRTADWREEALITEPFDECGGTTHVLRLSWSPDGQYLVSAHAMNGGGPTAQIIEREGWSTDKDFVGHRKAITCVRFNSNILQRALPHSVKTQQYCCCAIGSRDRSLSVWLTALKRPLVILKELFSSSVLDTTWSAGGLQLMACSWDGTVAYVQFTEAEMGKPLSASDKSALHERMYGKSLSIPNSLASATLVENPELLGLREKQQKKATSVANHSPSPQRSTLASTNSNTSSPMKGPIDKQIETRTSDGKRRITPMYIPPAPDTGEAPLPFGSLGISQPTFSSSSESRSRIVVEKRDDIVCPNVSSSLARKPQGESSCSSHAPEVRPPQAPAVEVKASPVTVVSTTATTTANGHSQSSVEDAKPTMDSKVEKPDVPVAGSSPKRATSTVVKPGVPKRGRPPLSERPMTQQPAPSAPPLTAVRQGSEPEIRLSPLNIEKSLVIQVSGCPGKILEVENSALSSPQGPLHRIKCRSTQNSQEQQDQVTTWEAVLGSRAVAVSANQLLSLVACEDRSLHVYETNHGRCPLPPLHLAARPHRLVASRGYVMLVSTQAKVSVWDVLAKRAVLSEEPMLHLLADQSASIINCLVSEQGNPLITLSSGKAFMFCSQLKSWLLMGDSKDPVQQTSGHQLFAAAAAASNQTSVNSILPLAILQGSSRSLKGRHLQAANSSSGPICTLTFLEQQLARSRSLASPKDYHLWLSTMVRYLVHEGLEWRLRLICDELLGPAHSRASQSRTWDSQLMGMSKHTLLRETLHVIASNLSLQRLYSEYGDQLDAISEREADKNNA